MEEEPRLLLELVWEDTRRTERNLGARLGARVPVGDCLDVLAGDGLPILEAEQVFEQNADGVREGVDAFEAGPGQRIQAVNLDLTTAGMDCDVALEGVL